LKMVRLTSSQGKIDFLRPLPAEFSCGFTMVQGNT
jgi:hypothetical protein